MSLEVVYDIGTGEVRAWCADPKRFGNLKAKAGQKVVVLPIKVATIPPGRDYMVDLDAKTVYPRTPHVEPPDYKAQWKVAKTPAEKLSILGRMMGLERRGERGED